MGTTLDAKSSAATIANSASGSTGVTHALLTIGALATAATFDITLFTTGNSAVTMTVVWDSGGTNQSCTQIVTKQLGNSGANSRGVWQFGLLNPTTGNKTLKVTWTSTGGTDDLVVAGQSWNGTDTSSFANCFNHTATNDDSAGATATSTVTVTTTTNDAAVAVHLADQPLSGLSNTPGFTTGSGIATGANLFTANNFEVGGSSATLTVTLGVADNWVNCATNIAGASATATVEEDNSRVPRRYWVGWTPNASLLRNTAQDFSSPGVETNPHWRPWTRPAQWNPLAVLWQNAAVDVPPVVTPDTPPPFKPSSWPLQWSRDWRLFRTTAQDFSSFGVETNPHWISRPWAVQWAPLSLLRATPNDAPAPIPPDTPPHWQSKPWPVQWNLLLALRQTPADDVPPVTPETNTFFTPRTFPLQWLLQPSLRQTTAQDFSFLGIATSVHLIPRTWPLQWSLQASLMRGTAQDFSTTPPATNPVYARYGAAHGIGMLSAIPGEIPS